MKLHKYRFIILISLLCLFLPGGSSAEQVTKKVFIADSALAAKISIYIADSGGYADVRLFLTRSAESATKKVHLTMQKSEADFVLDFVGTADKGDVSVFFTDSSGEATTRIFFAPSADDIIKTKAAFGCSHYARSFIAVVKALGLIDNPENLE